MTDHERVSMAAKLITVGWEMAPGSGPEDFAEFARGILLGLEVILTHEEDTENG